MLEQIAISGLGTLQLERVDLEGRKKSLLELCGNFLVSWQPSKTRNGLFRLVQFNLCGYWWYEK